VSSRGFRRKVQKLEREIVSGLEEESIDVVLYGGSDGGIFGHVHCHLCGSQGDSKPSPCSDEEKVEVMRQHYEIDRHRPWGRGDEVPFWKYLETFSYLAPDGLAERLTKNTVPTCSFGYATLSDSFLSQKPRLYRFAIYTIQLSYGRRCLWNLI